MRRRHLESVSSRSLSVRGSWGAAPSVFWFLLCEQKERPGGEPYRLSPSGDSTPPKATTNYPRRVGVLTKPCKRREEINAIVSAGNPSGSFHSPPLFAQGRLWAYRQATANLANSLLLLLRGKAAFRRRAAIFPRRVGKAGKNRMNTGKKA